MPERWVVNASPLISLGRIGCESWLTELADEVVIPEDVASEVAAGPDDQARRAVCAGMIPVVAAPPPTPELSAWDLGKGETSVLSYTLANPGWTAILDDGAARRCGRSLGLRVKGCLAIVILARQHGLTDSAAQVLSALRAQGFRLKDQVIAQALRATVGEDWPTG